MQKNKLPRRSYDNYPTPLPLAQIGVELALRYVKSFRTVDRPWNVCEFACGDTQPFLQSMRHVLEDMMDCEVCYTGIDIRTIAAVNPQFNILHQDLTSFDSQQLFDVIVMNPPFKYAATLATVALQHLREGGVVAMVGRQSFYAWSKDRDAFWQQYPPTHVAVISPRPSFSGDGKTDGCEYAYYLWAPWMGTGQTTLGRIFWSKPKK